MEIALLNQPGAEGIGGEVDVVRGAVQLQEQLHLACVPALTDDCHHSPPQHGKCRIGSGWYVRKDPVYVQHLPIIQELR